jgi:hypothetical protein
MNTDTFWKLIENAQCKADDGWIELDHNALIDALTHLSAEDIQEFGRIFWHMKAKAYREDIWDAAFLIACGCGDDAFDAVKDWLIVQGREIYETVLNDPENLADIVPRTHRFDLYDVRLPERDITVMHVAEVAYKRKTGQPIPEYGYAEVPVLIGENSLSEEEIPAKFPRIMEKLGKYSDEDVEAKWF